MSSGLLQVFVELGNLHGTSNYFVSVKVPEFDKHLKKAGGHISRNVVDITVKTIVRKPLMIKINKLRLRNLDN